MVIQILNPSEQNEMISAGDKKISKLSELLAHIYDELLYILDSTTSPCCSERAAQSCQVFWIMSFQIECTEHLIILALRSFMKGLY